jgi:multidrug efflux pump subunit AcrA (membrane-fusion protein)
MRESMTDHSNDCGGSRAGVQQQTELPEAENTTVLAEERPHRGSTKSALLVGLFVLIVFVITVVLGYIPRLRRGQVIAKEAERQKTEAPGVIVTAATRSKANMELSLPGSSAARVEAPIYGRASGYISKRYVDIGDRVKAGQLLAIIDAPDLDRQIDQARASLQQSESVLRQVEAQAELASVTWERYKVLVERGVFSKQDGDTQRASYNVSQANVQAARDTVNASKANLQRLLKLQSYERVTAPFAGVVTARNIDVGSLISASGGGLGATNAASAALPNTGTASQGGEMFRVAQVDSLRVFVTVPENKAQSVVIGQTVNLRFDSVPGRVFQGKVARTANAVDPASRTLLTEVHVENKDGVLLPGTYVTATFNNLRAAPPIIVPGDAVITRSSGTMIAIVRNNVVHLQPVALGRDYGSQTEIREGLREGDLVILNPGDGAQEGARVNARVLSANQQTVQSPGQQQRP